MSSLFEELKRRKVFRVAAAYAIVAWILVEVAATVLPIFEAPDWTVQVFTVFVILGFPVALILSWAYDLTLRGVERTKDLPPVEGVTQATGHTLEFAIIGALVVVLGFVVLDAYVLTGESDDVAELPAPAAAVEQRVPTVVSEEPVRAVLPNSVAVLPFENLSPDPENEFFAAGIHEEVLNQLAKLSALSVIARTTMVQYADRDKSIPQIAAELNVETVMEGSVRYADGRVLVTAQLIDPETNVHLWSESYNREFADIFAIQADIAMNIANALEAEFSLDEQEQIEKLPTDSPEAYALYLRAMQEVAGPAASRYLNAAIAIDPDFALAYGTRAWSAALSFRYIAGGQLAAETERSVRADVAQALALDPTVSIAHVASALLDESLWRAAEARAGYRRALWLKARSPEIMIWFASLRANLGEVEGAIQIARRAVELDPSNFLYHLVLGNILLSAGNYAEARLAAQNASRLEPTESGPLMLAAFVAIRRGDNAEAVSKLRLAEELTFRSSQYQLPRLALAYAQAGEPQDAQRVVALFEQTNEPSRSEIAATPAAWIVAYIAIGDYVEALVRLIDALGRNEPGDFVVLNEIRTNFYDDPVLAGDPRFVEARSRLRFTD